MLQIIPIERLDWAVKLLLAQGVIILFMLLNIVSFSLPHAGDFKPFFLLMAVYYWAIYRPSLMPVAYTFLLGIVLDLISGLPVGVSALVLVGIKMMVQSQRLFLLSQPYVTVWVGFAGVVLVNIAVLWVVMSLQTLSLVPLQSIMIAAAFSVMIFPLASLILLGVHRILPLPQGHFIR